MNETGIMPLEPNLIAVFAARRFTEVLITPNLIQTRVTCLFLGLFLNMTYLISELKI